LTNGILCCTIPSPLVGSHVVHSETRLLSADTRIFPSRFVRILCEKLLNFERSARPPFSSVEIARRHGKWNGAFLARVPGLGIHVFEKIRQERDDAISTASSGSYFANQRFAAGALAGAGAAAALSSSSLLELLYSVFNLMMVGPDMSDHDVLRTHTALVMKLMCIMMLPERKTMIKLAVTKYTLPCMIHGVRYREEGGASCGAASPCNGRSRLILITRCTAVPAVGVLCVWSRSSRSTPT
jgi:hypothetical protein